MTLAIDKTSAKVFDDLRQAHFPKHRNLVSAHITLFHNLPGAESERIVDDLKTMVITHKRFGLSTAGIQFLGAGVAIRLEAPELMSIHADLARLWHDWLLSQDKQRYRPHVTIQNKVLPGAAKQLAAQLEHDPPMSVRAEGLVLWRYLGGPWEYVAKFDFC